jgi:hypothetical protein
VFIPTEIAWVVERSLTADRLSVSLSAAVPQGLEQQCESWCGLAATWIVEVISGKGRTPVREHVHEPPFFDERLYVIFRQIG